MASNDNEASSFGTREIFPLKLPFGFADVHKHNNIDISLFIYIYTYYISVNTYYLTSLHFFLSLTNNKCCKVG